MQLLEQNVLVVAREKDQDVLKKSVEQAKKNYKDISGRDVEIEVKHDLSKDSSGGVVLYGHNGRIKIDNTLDARLKLLEEQVSRARSGRAKADGTVAGCAHDFFSPSFLSQMLPEIRLDLFGPNPNRKFVT